jgi:hypothetical protein
VSGLGALAKSAAIYIRLARAVAELAPSEISDDLRQAIERQRTITRDFMAQFFLIDAGAVNDCTFRPDGLDHDIAALCDVPAVQ